jgi:hypothetical protein
MLSPNVPYHLPGPRDADWTLYALCTYWEPMFVPKIIMLRIHTPVACVLLFRIKNIILTTYFRYRSGSKRQRICRCSRNSSSILTNVLFISEFLAKSNAKLSFSYSTYSEMSQKILVNNTIKHNLQFKINFK